MSTNVAQTTNSTPPTQESPHAKNHNPHPFSIFSSFRHLNSLIIMIVLASTGMVPIENIILFFFSIFYLFFLSKIAFPILPSTDNKPVFNQQSKILNIYILFAAIIGLFLPILYIFFGIFEGDPDGIKASVPHVFLLSTQVFMEGVSYFGGFSLPIRVFVPVFYNSTRMFTLYGWFKDEFFNVGEENFDGYLKRLYVGKALAVANLMLWGYNLFGFLLPVYLPRAFKKYYSGDSSVGKKD